ncbi:hypothetical protein IM40_06200 [Candidatus Paracaedimonas acanthamoebae]|nr:hypothetical protein IM40_06200 [Candidatus Paracaedimonas acanthamoebae]
MGIIIGSTRPNKIGGQVAEWVFQQVQEAPNLQFTLVDLEKWNLPLFNEPGMPLNGPKTYVHAHTKKWGHEIASYDGYIFVTPQYNCGYPASLKNAIDYLYAEWKDKPAIIISYGFQDGGAKAAMQLKQVLESFKMKFSSTMPAIGLAPQMLNEKKKLKNASEDFKPYREAVLNAVNELVESLKYLS